MRPKVIWKPVCYVFRYHWDMTLYDEAKGEGGGTIVTKRTGGPEEQTELKRWLGT